LRHVRLGCCTGDFYAVKLTGHESLPIGRSMSRTSPGFTPHALIATERSVPEPMFVAAVIGVERLLRFDLDASAPPLTFAGQALRAVRRRLADWRSDQLPAFGRPTGVVVNYGPDCAVAFDMNGAPRAVLASAKQVGHVELVAEDG
jgi:hypothetical protein